MGHWQGPSLTPAPAMSHRGASRLLADREIASDREIGLDREIMVPWLSWAPAVAS